MSIMDYFDEMSAIWDNAVTHNKNYIREMLELIKIKDGDNLLDVGSGTGVLVDYIREFDVVGNILEVDISQKMLNMARAKNYNDVNISYLKIDVEKDDIDGEFDAILIYNCLPYLRNKVNTIAKLYERNLKQGGAISIFHSHGEKYINNFLSCADKRISNASLPNMDVFLKNMADYGINIRFSSDNSDAYTIVISK